MTAKQDDTSKLVQRIVMSIASVACVFILNAANSRLDSIDSKLQTLKSVQDIDHTSFRVNQAINDGRIRVLEDRTRSIELGVRANTKSLKDNDDS